MGIADEVKRLEEECRYLCGWKAGALGEVYGPGSAEEFVRGYEEGQGRAADALYVAGLREGLAGEWAKDGPTCEPLERGRKEGTDMRQRVAAKALEANEPDTIRLVRERNEAVEERDQLRVQLAGCGVAARDASTALECKPGDYGWSPAYANVLALRRCMEEVRKRIGVTLEDYEAAKYDAHAATLAVLERVLGNAFTFNMNDTIRVDLTPYGKDVIRSGRWASWCEFDGDALRDQAWVVFSALGPKISMGGEQMVVNNLVTVERAESVDVQEERFRRQLSGYRERGAADADNCRALTAAMGEVKRLEEEYERLGDARSDALRWAADLAGDFDPFDPSWSDEQRLAGERALELFAAKLRREEGDAWARRNKDARADIPHVWRGVVTGVQTATERAMGLDPSAPVSSTNTCSVGDKTLTTQTAPRAWDAEPTPPTEWHLSESSRVYADGDEWGVVSALEFDLPRRGGVEFVVNVVAEGTGELAVRLDGLAEVASVRTVADAGMSGWTGTRWLDAGKHRFEVIVRRGLRVSGRMVHARLVAEPTEEPDQVEEDDRLTPAEIARLREMLAQTNGGAK